jgi:hypothetical protein
VTDRRTFRILTSSPQSSNYSMYNSNAHIPKQHTSSNKNTHKVTHYTKDPLQLHIRKATVIITFRYIGTYPVVNCCTINWHQQTHAQDADEHDSWYTQLAVHCWSRWQFGNSKIFDNELSVWHLNSRATRRNKVLPYQSQTKPRPLFVSVCLILSVDGIYIYTEGRSMGGGWRCGGQRLERGWHGQDGEAHAKQCSRAVVDRRDELLREWKG